MTARRHLVRTGSAGFAAAMLLAATVAHSTLKIVEEAYELPLSRVTLPSDENGTVSLRSCLGCKLETLRVTQDTRYFIRATSGPVTLAEARDAAASAAGRRQASVYLYYDRKTRIVLRLVVDPGP